MGAALTPLKPGSTVGILGGGQLGRMLALAASRLGLKTHVYADEAGSACAVTNHATIAPFDDLDRLRAFADTVDVVTYEFENVPLQAVHVVSQRVPVRPGARALEVSQERLAEKRYIAGLGIPVAPFAPVSATEDFAAALAVTGTPAILKTCRLGYDGKGQVRVASPDELGAAFEAVGGLPCVLEGRIAFRSEVSVLLVRGLDGSVAFYDLPRNEHDNGILCRSTVPSGLPQAELAAARAIGAAIAEGIDYVGVLAAELFWTGDPARPLVVNEIAPRVHNSGHWTMDACWVSQFENHIRAIAGWPLGSTDRHSDAVMENLIGPEIGRWHELAALPATALHVYDKGEAPAGRKMGHFNRLSRRSEG
jgi:5-(carboxyamino)imidazole ribonucleotide synthase